MPYPAPLLLAMLVLIGASAFFSASEAALFSLRMPDIRSLRSGSRAERIAASLLADPERLLSAVLFWNLAINMVYFALATLMALFLERRTSWGATGGVAFTGLALLLIIFFSEMLPKSIAILNATGLSPVLSIPLAAAVRLADPIMPLLRAAQILSRRLIWPNFKSENYLDTTDLERAIELSTSDANLIEQEKTALRNIVLLSDIRVDEWMRPRTQFRTFRPPVWRKSLPEAFLDSGYLLIADPKTDEIMAAIHLDSLCELPERHLERLAQEVVYVPWCATVADALQQMRRGLREVAAIVNEFGETIGIITYDDILDTVFDYNPSRSKLLLDRKPIHDLGPGKWLVAGVTSLRRLARYLNRELPRSKSVTVGGVIQECLERLVREGDACYWGPFHLKVREAPQRGHMLIEITLRELATKNEEHRVTLGIAFFAVGLFLVAFFSGSETGFYRAPRARLVLDGLGGDTIARGLLWLTNNPSLFVATTLIGNNLANYLTTRGIVLLAVSQFTSEGVWVEMLATIAASPVVFVYGELLPKHLYYHAPYRLLRLGGPLFLLCGVLFAPVSALLWTLGRLLETVLGQTPLKLQLSLARRELGQIMAEGQEAGILQPAQRDLAQNLIAMASRPVRTFCRSAARTPSITLDTPADQARRIARRFRLPFLPVRRTTGGEFVGFVRSIDLYLDTAPIEELIRELPFIRDTASYGEVLIQMHSRGQELTQVRNSASQTVGFLFAHELSQPLVKGQG